MPLTKISTEGVKDDAITKAKIPADQIEASELANNAVDTNAIQDQAVTLDKLPHGDSNNNGKFLRANNGADPSFETITIPASINNLVEDTSPQLGGNLDCNNKVVTLNDSSGNDNNRFKIGNAGDLSIYHDATNSILDNITGHLMTMIPAAKGFRVQKQGGQEDILNAYADGSVQLYYNGQKKLETTNAGINMPTGTAVFGGVSGSSWVVEVNPIAANSYGMNIKESSNSNDGYPLFQISNNDGSMPRFRVLSGGVAQTSRVQPYQTNTHNLGSSTRRWAAIFSVNSLNTSDKNLKNSIADSDLGLSFINKLRPVSYKWNQIKGENLDTKTHYGFIAQEIETALISENKTLNDFAGVYKPDDYKEDGTGEAMGIQTNDILSPLVKAVQELSNKVQQLETKVAALETA